MSIKTFKDLIVWQKAHCLTLKVYFLTSKYPKQEIFALASQTQRAAVSVPANLAEGYRRNSKNDSLHFYNIAQSSLEELKYHLLLGKDLKYIQEQEYLAIDSLAEECSKLLARWIFSQKQLN